MSIISCYRVAATCSVNHPDRPTPVSYTHLIAQFRTLRDAFTRAVSTVVLWILDLFARLVPESVAPSGAGGGGGDLGLGALEQAETALFWVVLERVAFGVAVLGMVALALWPVSYTHLVSSAIIFRAAPSSMTSSSW